MDRSFYSSLVTGFDFTNSILFFKQMSHQIGDNIKCTKTHSQRAVVKGKTYPLLGIEKNLCCGYITFDVGIPGTSEYGECGKCGAYYKKSRADVWFIGIDLFAEQSQYPSAISELLSKEITIERSDAQPKEVETLK